MIEKFVMSVRIWSLLFAFVGLVFFGAGETHADSSAAAKPSKSAGAPPKNLNVLVAQCRAGTFDIRRVGSSETTLTLARGLAFACLSLASPSYSPSASSGSPEVDERALKLARQARFARDARDRTKSLEELCRAAFPADSGVSPRQCQLIGSALRRNQGSKDLCRRAREMGEEKFGCSPNMIFMDGDPGLLRDDGSKATMLENREIARLVGSLRSDDPKDCAASPLCKVLSSDDARDCDPYLKRANKAFCEMIIHEGAQAEGARKRNFKAGEAMNTTPPEVLKRMKAIEAAGQTGKKP
ncbi:MAG: hypothetical protein ACHQ49_01880 [Elusimicrobiota bacterium]